MVLVLLVLVSAVAQLAVPAPSTPPSPGRLNLNQIIQTIPKCNQTFANEFFVEDVQELVDAGCKEDFFCKVHNILHKHEKFADTKKDEVALVHHLKAYTNNEHINCTEVLKTVKNSTVTRPITVLLENLMKCTKRRNLVKN